MNKTATNAPKPKQSDTALPFTGRGTIDLTIPHELQKGKFPSLDGLRALSILLVLIAHLSMPYTRNKAIRVPMTILGLLGVQVFFVISGFLITTLLLKEKASSGTISLKDFYIRRALRILPVVFLYLGFLAVMNSAFHLEIPLAAFLGATFFLANLPPFQQSWYTAHFWSLSIEEQYYLGYPFILKRFTSSLHYILSSLILVVFLIQTGVIGEYLPKWPVFEWIGQLTYQSDGVLVGSLMSLLCFRSAIPISLARRHGPVLLFALPILIAVYQFKWMGSHFLLTQTLSSFMIAIFLLCAIIQENHIVFRLLNFRPLMFIGKLSFSIYIWQQFFTHVGGTFKRSTQLPYNLVLILLVGYLSYTLFEKRFLKLKQRFKR